MRMSNNGARNKTVTVAGVTVAVRELTVEEINQWMDDKTSPSETSLSNPLLSLMPVGEMMLGDLLRMTDLTETSIKTLTGSDLETIGDTCRELNKSFFAIAATIRMAGAVALNQLAEKSTEPVPP